MKWTDVQDIAIELYEKYPEVDPLTLSFVDLHAKVCALEGFDDEPSRSGEKILEGIQQAWIEEL